MQLAFIMGPSSETNSSIISPLGPEDPYTALEELPPLECDSGNASDGTINSREPALEQHPTAFSSQIATLTPPQRCSESSNGEHPAEPREEGRHNVALSSTHLEGGRPLVSNGAVVGGTGGDPTSQWVSSGQQAYPMPLATPGSLSSGSITRECNSSDTFPQLVYPCPLPPPVSVFATAHASPFEASAPHPLDTHQQMAHSGKMQQMIVRSRSVSGGGGGGSRSGGHRSSRQRLAKGGYCNAMFIREKGRASLDYGMSQEQVHDHTLSIPSLSPRGFGSARMSLFDLKIWVENAKPQNDDLYRSNVSCEALVNVVGALHSCGAGEKQERGLKLVKG